MSLDSRRPGFSSLNSSNNNQVFKVKAQPGLLPPSAAPIQPASNQDDQQQQTQEVEITYSDLRTIGNGSFGVVFQASLQHPTQEQIAIKKVLQDKRFKNRELQIMRRLDHCNVVKLKYFFHTYGDRSSEVYLNLVLEYIPETLYKIARQHSRNRQPFPILLIKLYMYQLFRSLNYIHSMDICHRDIKPQNLLLNPETGVLKLCDFGSAKSLVGGEPNVAYICSRYYRAPELIFGATDYTTKIDIWSAGCVMAELILGEPMFPGESGVDQLVEIIKILGTPTREQMRAMNPNYTEFRFPVIKARSWNRIFSIQRTPPEAARLVSNLLEYTPFNRLTPLGACAHPFFDELRSSSTNTLPNGREFPPLFNFSEEELRREPHLAPRLLPCQISAPSANTAAAATTTPNQQQRQQNKLANTSGQQASGGGSNVNAASSSNVTGSSSSNITGSPGHSVASNVTVSTTTMGTSNVAATTTSSTTLSNTISNSNINNNNNNTTTSTSTASNNNSNDDLSGGAGGGGPNRDTNHVL